VEVAGLYESLHGVNLQVVADGDDGLCAQLYTQQVGGSNPSVRTIIDQQKQALRGFVAAGLSRSGPFLNAV